MAAPVTAERSDLLMLCGQRDSPLLCGTADRSLSRRPKPISPLSLPQTVETSLDLLSLCGLPRLVRPEHDEART